MNAQYSRLAEAAAQIVNNGFVMPLSGTGKRATIYISPIETASPLTVSTARRLLFAKSLAVLLSEAGYVVQCHGLFADYAEAVENLTMSVWLRYLELCGESVVYPDACYQGDYIFDFAATVHRTYGERWQVAGKAVIESLSQVHRGTDRFDQIQAWLGAEGVSAIQRIGLQSLRQDIDNDLQEMGVSVDPWPCASDLLRDHTVTAALDRLQANGLVRTDGRFRYLPLAASDRQYLESAAGPTPFAIQLSHFLSMFAANGVKSELNICIHDMDQTRTIQCILHCARSLGCVNAAIIEKPIASPQLSEQGELVHTSPLAEDFVSFREARQTIGLPNLQWSLAQRYSKEEVKIDISQPANGLRIQECISTGQNPLISGMSSDATRWTTVLNALNPSQRQHAESFLQSVAEFHDVAQRAMQRLEPALMVNYYGKLCERFLSYYNNHELIVRRRNVNTHSHNQQNDVQGDEEWVATAMTVALQRLLVLIDSLIGPEP